MQDYQKAFLEFVLANGILRFGEFTLKSGRQSPYFFNVGLFNSGEKLAFLARCYAAAIAESDVDYDLLFGPAYKGIPLVSATAMALMADHGVDKPFCFNRKEVKDHGEGGQVVGAELSGDVMVIDDVITAGTAVREAVEILRAHGARLKGIAVAMDRQEKGSGELSAIQEVEQEYGIKVVSIISLADIITFLEGSGDSELRQHLDAVNAYRERYGV